MGGFTFFLLLLWEEMSTFDFYEQYEFGVIEEKVFIDRRIERIHLVNIY